MIASGNRSPVKAVQGRLKEYADVARPLELVFEFNPSGMSRTRTMTLQTGGAPGSRGGYDFRDETEAMRAAQGVTVNAESLTLKILLDATDRMDAGDAQATQYGVQPELDTIRSMMELKVQTKEGARTLAAINQGDQRAFARRQHASVLRFTWGAQTLPVFMIQAQFELKEFLPSLLPYRAEATLTLQVIESNNPMYTNELKRQFASANQTASLL